MPRDRFELVPVSKDPGMVGHFVIWDSQHQRHVFKFVHFNQREATEVVDELNQIVSGSL